MPEIIEDPRTRRYRFNGNSSLTSMSRTEALKTSKRDSAKQKREQSMVKSIDGSDNVYSSSKQADKIPESAMPTLTATDMLELLIDPNTVNLIDRQISGLQNFIRQRTQGYESGELLALSDILAVVADRVEKQVHKRFAPLLAHLIAILQKPIRTKVAAESKEQSNVLRRLVRKFGVLLQSSDERVQVAAVETLAHCVRQKQTVYSSPDRKLEDSIPTKINTLTSQLQHTIQHSSILRLISNVFCDEITQLVNHIYQDTDNTKEPPMPPPSPPRNQTQEESQTYMEDDNNGQPTVNIPEPSDAKLDEDSDEDLDILANTLGSTAALRTPLVSPIKSKNKTAHATQIQSSYFVEVIARFLELVSRHGESARRLTRYGISSSLITVVDYIGSMNFREALVEHALGALWNLAEHSSKHLASGDVAISLPALVRKHRFHNASYVLSKRSAFRVFNRLLNQVLESSSRASDKSIRNEVVIVATLISRTPSPPPIMTATLASLITRDGSANMTATDTINEIPHNSEGFTRMENYDSISSAVHIDDYSSSLQNSLFHSGGQLCLESGLLDSALAYSCACEMGLQTNASFRSFGTCEDDDLQLKQLLWDMILVCINAEAEAYSYTASAAAEVRRYDSCLEIPLLSDAPTHTSTKMHSSGHQRPTQQLGSGITSGAMEEAAAKFNWPVLSRVRESLFLHTLLLYLDPAQENHPYLVTWSPAQRRSLELHALSSLLQVAPRCLPEFGASGGPEVCILYLRKHSDSLSVTQRRGRRLTDIPMVAQMLQREGLYTQYVQRYSDKTGMAAVGSLAEFTGMRHVENKQGDAGMDEEELFMTVDEDNVQQYVDGEEDLDRLYLILRLIACTAGSAAGTSGVVAMLPWHMQGTSSGLSAASTQGNSRDTRVPLISVPGQAPAIAFIHRIETAKRIAGQVRDNTFIPMTANPSNSVSHDTNVHQMDSSSRINLAQEQQLRSEYRLDISDAVIRGGLGGAAWVPIDYAREFGRAGTIDDLVCLLADIAVNADTIVGRAGDVSQLESGSSATLVTGDRMGSSTLVAATKSIYHPEDKKKNSLGVVNSTGGASTPIGHVVEAALFAIASLCRARQIPRPEIRGQTVSDQENTGGDQSSSTHSIQSQEMLHENSHQTETNSFTDIKTQNQPTNPKTDSYEGLSDNRLTIDNTMDNTIDTVAAKAVEAASTLATEVDLIACRNQERFVQCGGTEILIVWLRAYAKKRARANRDQLLQAASVNGISRSHQARPSLHHATQQHVSSAHLEQDVQGLSTRGAGASYSDNSTNPSNKNKNVESPQDGAAGGEGQAGEGAGRPRLGAAIIGALWAVCENPNAAEAFLHADGVPLLLDLLDVCPREENIQIIGFLADLARFGVCKSSNSTVPKTIISSDSSNQRFDDSIASVTENNKKIGTDVDMNTDMSDSSSPNHPYLHENKVRAGATRTFIKGWRSSQSGISAVELLLSIWLTEERRLGVARGQHGEILELFRPLDGKQVGISENTQTVDNDSKLEHSESISSIPSFASQTSMVHEEAATDHIKRIRPHVTKVSISGSNLNTLQKQQNTDSIKAKNAKTKNAMTQSAMTKGGVSTAFDRLREALRAANMWRQLDTTSKVTQPKIGVYGFAARPVASIRTVVDASLDIRAKIYALLSTFGFDAIQEGAAGDFSRVRTDAHLLTALVLVSHFHELLLGAAWDDVRRELLGEPVEGWQTSRLEAANTIQISNEVTDQNRIVVPSSTHVGLPSARVYMKPIGADAALLSTELEEATKSTLMAQQQQTEIVAAAEVAKKEIENDVMRNVLVRRAADEKNAELAYSARIRLRGNRTGTISSNTSYNKK